jgi:hypothetical protein
MAKVDKERLRRILIGIKNSRLSLQYVLTLNQEAIEKEMQLHPTEKPARKRRQLQALLSNKQFLKKYKEYLEHKIKDEKKSARAIAADLGFDYHTVCNHIASFEIVPLSKEEAIRATMKRKGMGSKHKKGQRRVQIGVVKIKEKDWGTLEEREKMTKLLKKVDEKYDKDKRYRDRRKKRKRGRII